MILHKYLIKFNNLKLKFKIISDNSSEIYKVVRKPFKENNKWYVVVRSERDLTYYRIPITTNLFHSMIHK